MKKKLYVAGVTSYEDSSGMPVFVFIQGLYTKTDVGLYAGTRLKLHFIYIFCENVKGSDI